MRGHALDVFHQRDWIFEDMVIDALQNGSTMSASFVEEGAVGVVDVSAAVPFGVEKFTGDFKPARHRAYVVVMVHAQSLSG
jgi:hypothetical protein